MRLFQKVEGMKLQTALERLIQCETFAEQVRTALERAIPTGSFKVEAERCRVWVRWQLPDGRVYGLRKEWDEYCEYAYAGPGFRLLIIDNIVAAIERQKGEVC